MTSATDAVRNPASLTDEDRETLLASLAQACGGMAYDDVMGELARYAHPSLTPGARAALLAARRDCAVQAAGLRGALADYRGEMPGLCDREALELAIEALDDRAREAMHELVHGNGGAR